MRKIIAISDKYTLLSVDNGMTWSIQSTFSWACIININGRLIAGSNNDTGLWYSDDDGEYWINSDKMTGNWLTLQEINGRVCAGSDGGILYTDDAGEHWNKTNIITDMFDNGCNKNNAVYLGGSKLVYSYDGKYFEIEGINGKAIVNEFGSTVENYLYLDLHSKIFTYEEIDGKVLEVINKALLPFIRSDLFGTNNVNLNSYTTIKTSEGQKIVVGNDDVYKIHRTSSIINWKEDVGMQKFTPMTFSELIGSDDIIDAPLNDFDSISDGDNDKITNLISNIKVFLNYKKAILRNCINVDVNDCMIDDNIIVNLTEDMDMLSNNLEAKQIFEDAQKQSVMVVVDEMLNSIFAFDASNIKLLANAAIFEMIQACSGRIKIKLIDMNKELYGKGEDYKVNLEDFNLKLSFNKALETAYRYYIKCIGRNIQILNESDDKDLIAIAASYYRQTERQNYINSLDSILYDVSYSPTNVYVVEEAEITNLTSRMRNYIIDNAGDGYLAIKTAIDNMFNEGYGFQTNNRMLDMYRNTYNSYMINLWKDLSSKIVFSFPDPSEYTQYSTSEQNRIIKYLNEIHGKFLDRCSELMYVVFTNYENIQDVCDNDYKTFKYDYNKMLTTYKEKIHAFLLKGDYSESAVNSFFLKTKVDTIYSTIMPLTNNFMDNLIKSYINQKEAI